MVLKCDIAALRLDSTILELYWRSTSKGLNKYTNYKTIKLSKPNDFP